MLCGAKVYFTFDESVRLSGDEVFDSLIRVTFDGEVTASFHKFSGLGLLNRVVKIVVGGLKGEGNVSVGSNFLFCGIWCCALTFLLFARSSSQPEQ